MEYIVKPENTFEPNCVIEICRTKCDDFCAGRCDSLCGSYCPGDGCGVWCGRVNYVPNIG